MFQNFKILNFVFFLFLFFSIKDYAFSSDQKNIQNKSSLNIQAIQTRTYKDASYKEVFRSVINVLQNNKFKIRFTDMNAGVITAEGTPQAKENISKGLAAGIDFFTGGLASILRVKKTNKWTLSSNVEELSNNRGTLVRIVITNESKKSGFLTKAKDEDNVDDLIGANPKVYQSLFAKIDKEIFIRSSTR